MCFPDNKIRVCLDAEYAHRDTDEILKICDFQDEAEEFAENWATSQAEKMVAKSDPDFKAVKRIYRRQLCYYNFDKAPKSKHLVYSSKAFWRWDLGTGKKTVESKNQDFADAMMQLSKEISNANAPVKFVTVADKLEDIIQIIGYKNIEKNLKTDAEKILSIDFFFRDTILNENVKDEIVKDN